MENGIDFLRIMVEWLNSRNEHLNQRKTIEQLRADFIQSLYDELNFYGYANFNGRVIYAAAIKSMAKANGVNLKYTPAQ